MLKKLLFLLLLTFSAEGVWGQTPYTVTGTVQSATGGLATSGTVRFTIKPTSGSLLYYVAGTTVIAPQTSTCGINTSGLIKNATNLANPCTVWGNDLITPGNTTYDVQFVPNGVVTNTIHQIGINSVCTNLNSPCFMPIVSVVPQYQTITTNPISINLIPAAPHVFNVGQAAVPYAAGYFDNLFVTGACVGCNSLPAGVPGDLIKYATGTVPGDAGFLATDVGRLSQNNTFTGTNIFSGPVATALTQYTVGTLPNPATTVPTREIVVVTDGLTAADCSSGGGTTAALCRTSGAAWVALGGLFSGTIASPQVAFASATNTISGSNNFEYVPASGGVVITTSNVGPTNVTGAGLAMSNSGGGTTTAYLVKGTDNSLSLRNDAALIPAKGLLRWDTNSNMLLQGGSNSPQMTFYTGASISPFGDGAAVIDLFSTGATPHVFAVHADPGAGDAGNIAFNPFTSCMTIYGDTSGNAAICTPLAAGTPNPIDLPTTTGTAGQVFTTNGANPQLTSWTTPFVGEYCGATSGGTQACAKTVQTAPIIIHGDVTLNTATSQSITTLPFADDTYSCTGSDLTTAAGVVAFSSYLAASVTITETGGANTDHLRYVCVGN